MRLIRSRRRPPSVRRLTVDNGAVTIWQQQVPTGSSGEWDVFYMKTTNGGPIAGNVNANWNITMDYTLTAPVFFDQVVQQWVADGTPVTPVHNGIGSICCAAESNPILPGWSYYNSGFSVSYPAGPFPNWQQVFVDPYSLVSAGGINPSTANEFIFALHFTLQSAVPTITNVISASQYGAFTSISPGDWIEIYGTNLGEVSQIWSGSDFSGVNSAFAPTTLGGTSATIAGLAPGYVGLYQFNVVIPSIGASNNAPVTFSLGGTPGTQKFYLPIEN